MLTVVGGHLHVAMAEMDHPAVDKMKRGDRRHRDNGENAERFDPARHLGSRRTPGFGLWTRGHVGHSGLRTGTQCTITDIMFKNVLPDSSGHAVRNRKSPIDRRVARTRAMLHQALLALIMEKGYEAISVADICERADVGRSTFYAHFTGKDDLKRS